MYLLCFRHCVYMMAKISPDPLEFIFEEQHEFGKKALRLYDRVKVISQRDDWAKKLKSAKFGGSEEYLPLQAADLLAYECQKKIRNLRYHANVSERKSMERLADNRRVGFVAYVEEALMTVKNQMREGGFANMLDYLRVDP